MLDKIANILSNVSGWFTPERSDRRHRKEIKKLLREIDDLFQKTNSANNRKRIDGKLKQLRKLREDFTS